MKNKSFILVFLSIVFVGVMGLLIFAMYKDDIVNVTINKSNNSNISSNGTNSTNGIVNNRTFNSGIINENEDGKLVENFNYTVTLLNNYQSFFNVNKMINDYYDMLVQKEYNVVLDMLDKEYVSKNGKNINNINDPTIDDYQDVTFYSKKMYANSGNSVVNYFVTGELQRYNFGEEVLEELLNVNFMIVVDSNTGAFSVTPLLNGIDMQTYIRSYSITNKKNIIANDNNIIDVLKYRDEEIGKYYLDYYKSIVYLNPEKAFEMLGTTSKQKISSNELFLSNSENIYEILNTTLFSYAVTGENGKRKYSLVTSNMDKIVIKENLIMDFTIEL